MTFLTEADCQAPVIALGECAELLGVPPHRIRYFYESGKLVDVPRVAQRRIFTLWEVYKLKQLLGGGGHRHNKERPK